MRPVLILILAGLLFAAPTVPPIACEPSISAYVISAIPPNGKKAVCLRLDPYWFTVTGNLTQIRTHFAPPAGPDWYKVTKEGLIGIPVKCSFFDVYRNGSHMEFGTDYSAVGITNPVVDANSQVISAEITGIAFLPQSLPREGDLVSVSYRCPLL